MSPHMLQFQCGHNETLHSTLFAPVGDTAQFVIDHIKSANRSLHVLAFWLTWLPIAEALLDAHARGVAVTVLLDQRSRRMRAEGADRLRLRPSAKLSSVVDYLAPVNVTVLRGVNLPRRTRFGSTAIFHHKALVIDASLVCLGSANWYASAFQSHDEHTVCFCSRAAATRIIQFADGRARAGSWQPHSAGASGCDRERNGTSLTTSLRVASAVASPTALQLVHGPAFGPECRLDEIWTRYLAMASKRVLIMHWQLQWPALAAPLLSASQRGVRVSIVAGNGLTASLLCAASAAKWAVSIFRLDDARLHPSEAATNETQHAAAAAKRSTIFHHKVVLVDDDLVLLGSVNMFDKSLRFDSEDLTVLRSAALSERFRRVVEGHTQLHRIEPGNCSNPTPPSNVTSVTN